MSYCLRIREDISDATRLFPRDASNFSKRTLRKVQFRTKKNPIQKQYAEFYSANIFIIKKSHENGREKKTQQN